MGVGLAWVVEVEVFMTGWLRLVLFKLLVCTWFPKASFLVCERVLIAIESLSLVPFLGTLSVLLWGLVGRGVIPVSLDLSFKFS